MIKDRITRIVANLTDGERSAREIATQLGISARTVVRHRRKAEKLRARANGAGC